MYRIAVIGDYDSICGFSAIGMMTFPVKDSNEAFDKLREIAELDFGIVFVTENVYSKIRLEYSRDNTIPAVIPIPGVSGNTGDGKRDVSGFVEKAVGSDIVS